MADANEHNSIPSVKFCEVCGQRYERKPSVGVSQWMKSRACSRKCARDIGQRNRVWPSKEDRFWSKVDKSPGHGPDGECWLWTANKLPYGYGTFHDKGKVRKAHIVSYEMNVGPVPCGTNVLHRCDMPNCVRHDHLFLGSHQDNMDDMVAKGRGDAPKGEAHHDAKLTEDQVRAIRNDPRPNTVIAKELGVTKGAIWLIKARRNWRHIV